MAAYYNEFDPYAAQWLRNLIAAGHIAPGDVDERSIVDVSPDDLKGYTQCHFFAGIGGWSLAFRIAGWGDKREVWSGSCPCQPLSSIGQHKGHADSRHLWPAFQRLIAERAPAVVFGEQVAGADGREWLAGVRADLEAMGYACGAADLCAAGVAAPHGRQRLYWVADADSAVEDERQASGKQPFRHRDNDYPQGVGHAPRRPSWPAGQPWQQSETIECDDGSRRIEPGAQPLAHGISTRMDKIRGYGNAIVPYLAAEFIMAFDEARP